MTPPRLEPLLAQYDFGCRRLIDRLAGPTMDSGSGTLVAVEPMTDAEYFWEPVAGCWSIRRRSDGPGKGATILAGAGDWGRDTASPAHPEPPNPTGQACLRWQIPICSSQCSRRRL